MAIGVVETKFGKVSGIEYDGKYKGITVFKGIPYAAPPVGKLRWAPTQDPEPWEGVRVCDKFGPAEVQTLPGGSHRADYYFNGLPEMSEDCLYMNVCTGAQKAGEKRPVFVWYHGGGLTNCHASEIQFNPQVLASKGIVCVTVGQRLGVFGYLALPQLTEEQGSSGNYGLMDQLKSLEWLYENIDAFGGDPDNITVGGQSGGAIKVCVMAGIPAAKGRVRRVINQSGLKWTHEFLTKEEAEKQGINYLKYVNLDPNISLEELRSLPTDVVFTDPPRSINPGNMVYDGDLIPYPTMYECFEKYLGNVDFLNGMNMGEADVFGESYAGLNDKPIRSYIPKINYAADFYAHYRNLLGELYDKYDFKNLVKVTDENAAFTARLMASQGLCGREVTNMSRNLMIDRLFGEYMGKNFPHNKAYTYYWTHKIPICDELKGTARDTEVSLPYHSTEMWFTFGSLREGIPPDRPWRQSDFELADTVSSYWANFMKTGDPNGEGLPYWPPSCDKLGYMELGDEPVAHQFEGTQFDKLVEEFVRREFAVLNL